MSEESDKWREHKYNEAWDALDYFADYTEKRLGADVEEICLCGGFARRDFGERRPEKIYYTIREAVENARRYPKDFPPEYSRITDDELHEIWLLSASRDTADFVRKVDEKLGKDASSIVRRERYSDIDGFVAVKEIPETIRDPFIVDNIVEKGNEIIKGKFDLSPFEPEISIQYAGMPSEGCVCRHRSGDLNKSKWEKK